MDSNTICPVDVNDKKRFSGDDKLRQTGRCLVCNNNCVVSSSDNLKQQDPPLEIQPKFLQEDLHAIFIVRKVLEIPVNLLSTHFKDDPGNPSEWGLIFCEDCEGEINKCKEIYEELLAVTRRYKNVQEEVIRKIKRSAGGGSVQDQFLLKDHRETSRKRKQTFAQKGENWKNVQELCRDFVSKNQYNTFSDPFLSGDLKAEELLTASLIVKDEFDENCAVFEEEPETNLDLVSDTTRTRGLYPTKFQVATKKKRGRPPKSKVEEELETNLDLVSGAATGLYHTKCDVAMKRKRGRPPKRKVEKDVDPLKEHYKNSFVIEPRLQDFENDKYSKGKQIIEWILPTDTANEEEEDFVATSEFEDSGSEYLEYKPELGKCLEDVGQEKADSAADSTEFNRPGPSKKRKGREDPIKLRTKIFCPICQQYICKRDRGDKVYEHLIKCGPGKSQEEEEVNLACCLCKVYKRTSLSEQDYLRFAEHIGVCQERKPIQNGEGDSQAAMDQPAQLPLSARIFWCDICLPRKHFNLEQYLKHYLFHKEYIYKCSHPDCVPSQKLYRFKISGIKSHWTSHHHDTGYKTTPPSKRYTEVSSLPSTQWWCAHCHQYFLNDDQRSQHLLNDHSRHQNTLSPQHQCRWCTKSFGTLEDLTLHQGTAHVEQQSFAKCDLCQQYFPNEIILGHHQRLQHKDPSKRLLCNHCGQTFGNKIWLDQHVSHYHKPELRKYMCPECGVLLASPDQLRVHKFKQHHSSSTEANPLECPHCKKMFGNVSNLKLHVESIHEKKFRFKCHHCGRGFSTNSWLKSHLATSHGDGDYNIFKCKEPGCEKVFRRKHYYEGHMARHRNKPEFNCTYCGKGFYLKERLKVHLLVHTHTDVKPFVCLICPLKFRIKAHLQLHINMHRKKGDDVSEMVKELKKYKKHPDKT